MTVPSPASTSSAAVPSEHSLAFAVRTLDVAEESVADLFAEADAALASAEDCDLQPFLKPSRPAHAFAGPRSTGPLQRETVPLPPAPKDRWEHEAPSQPPQKLGRKRAHAGWENIYLVETAEIRNRDLDAMECDEVADLASEVERLSLRAGSGLPPSKRRQLSGLFDNNEARHLDFLYELPFNQVQGEHIQLIMAATRRHLIRYFDVPLDHMRQTSDTISSLCGPVRRLSNYVHWILKLARSRVQGAHDEAAAGELLWSHIDRASRNGSDVKPMLEGLCRTLSPQIGLFSYFGSDGHFWQRLHFNLDKFIKAWGPQRRRLNLINRGG